MKWSDGITDSMDTSLSKLQETEGQGSLACCSPRDLKESYTTEGVNKDNKHTHSDMILSIEPSLSSHVRFCEFLRKVAPGLVLHEWRGGSRE